MGEGERFQLGTVGALTLSVVSSVSIVICNKALISSLGFTFGKFGTCFFWCGVVALYWYVFFLLMEFIQL